MKISRLVKLAGECGGYRFARFLTARNPRILMYHRFSKEPKPGYVDAKAFEWQVRHIAQHYNATTVSGLAEEIFSRGVASKNSIAITVDDGYRDFYNVAWPILKKYGVPATFYVTTGFVSGDLWLWPDQLRYLLERSPSTPGTYDLGLLKVQTPILEADFESEYWRINQLMLRAENSAKLDCLRAMENAWSIMLPLRPPKEFEAVTWQELQEMQQSGVEVGGHTVTHPSLARVSLMEAESEIVGSSEDLEKHLGKGIRSFCYPNGTPDDFVGEQVEAVKKAGFMCAAVAFSDCQEHGQRYAMRRHSVSADQFQFLKAVSGVELLGLKWRGRVLETPYG
ncbi:polysaccharide deacetylase [Marinobacter nauticus]|uniref:Polysaccharide deacetylase n=1 Tax=Marinobacter nauticus TaxID=2743 RepID=A0A368XW58_MARNT|nr:polysaccharide deacetylase family protein [Marinobacter nauticus]RCW72192.1 polysaccharide deacetylase [Marinobacter nauticus]